MDESYIYFLKKGLFRETQDISVLCVIPCNRLAVPIETGRLFRLNPATFVSERSDAGVDSFLTQISV